ncbi:hypothetical protein JHW43_001439, partial [Diplocarpon mali]
HRAAVAARGFVAAEQNFIPLLVSISAICSNPNLPNSAAPRVLVPPTAQLLANQTSRTRARIASSPTTPLADEFFNFTVGALDDVNLNDSTLRGTTAAAFNTKDTSNSPTSASSSPQAPPFPVPQQESVPAREKKPSLAKLQPANSALSNAITGYSGDFQASTVANHKFRLCLPTFKFKAGLNGRTTIQSTFEAEELSYDKAQQEALNPGVIACRIYDQLTNACSTNQAARTAAAAAQTLVTTLGRNETTADALHIVFGFSIAGHV